MNRRKEEEEFEQIYGQKRRWCSECRRRTLHEYDEGDGYLQSKFPAGWYCTECGLTDED